MKFRTTCPRAKLRGSGPGFTVPSLWNFLGKVKFFSSPVLKLWKRFVKQFKTMSFFQDKPDVQRLISAFDVFLQQEFLLPKKGSVNRLIMNFNQDLVSVTLGWLSFSVKVFLFKGCPGRVCVPLTFAFWMHTGSETPGRTHIPLPLPSPPRLLTGELSSCNHNHRMPLQGQPGRRAPL